MKETKCDKDAVRPRLRNGGPGLKVLLVNGRRTWRQSWNRQTKKQQKKNIQTERKCESETDGRTDGERLQLDLRRSAQIGGNDGGAFGDHRGRIVFLPLLSIHRRRCRRRPSTSSPKQTTGQAGLAPIPLPCLYEAHDNRRFWAKPPRSDLTCRNPL